jgi:hypothetical protein
VANQMRADAEAVQLVPAVCIRAPRRLRTGACLFCAGSAPNFVVQEVQRSLQTLDVGPREHCGAERLLAHSSGRPAVEKCQSGMQNSGGSCLLLLPPLSVHDVGERVFDAQPPSSSSGASSRGHSGV